MDNVGLRTGYIGWLRLIKDIQWTICLTKICVKKDTDSAYTPYTNDKKWPKQLNFEDYFDHFYDFAYTYPTR
jgi:hypothetical protein